MRKPIPLPYLLLFAALFFVCAMADAQQIPTTAQDSLKRDSVYKALFNRRGKSIYFEVAGPGALYSINYDFRFKKRQNGLGMRVGASYFYNGSDNVVTVPVVLNYLCGKKGHYLELGTGVTYFYMYSENQLFGGIANEDWISGYDANGIYHGPYFHSEHGAIGSVSIGYRYQPLKGGFNFRVGGGPVVTTQKEFKIWPYMSFGYSFKNKAKPKK